MWENPSTLSTHHHQPPAHCTHGEVDMVHGLAHILEHAAEGHEEVPMLVASVTAATVRNGRGEGAALPREAPSRIYPVRSNTKPPPITSLLLDISGAGGEEVHETGIEVGLCGGGGYERGCGAGQHPKVVGGPGRWGFSLTCEVEEGVEDVEALHVIPLDELVGIIVEDFGSGEGAWSCIPP